MNNLRRLRERARLSQTAVATGIGTTQQTYQRWETGKAQLPIEAVQKLSVFFKVPLAKVIGISDGAVMEYEPNVIIAARADLSFWGHLGLQLPAKASSQWFPISSSDKDRLYDYLESFDAEEEIFQVETLDNRVLFCRPEGIARYRLLSDACDKPFDDQQWSWTERRPLRDPTGLATDLYSALTAIVQCDDKSQTALGEGIVTQARSHLRQLGLDELTLAAALLHTRVHMIDGTIIRTTLDSGDLLDFASDLEEPYSNGLISFTDQNGCLDFIPRHQLAVVDIPRSVYYSAMIERYPPDRDMPLP